MSTTEDTHTVKVFVSYSSKDREFVVGLAERLQQVGLDIWLDVWRITGREPYWNEIQAGIEAASHVLFVISPTSISDNSAARDELAHAKHHRKTVVLVMAKAVDYDKLPLEITPGRYQVHDFTRLSYEEGILRVFRAITSATPPRPTAETPAPSKNSMKWGGITLAAVLLIALAAFVILPMLGDESKGDDSQQSQITATATATATETETPSPSPTDTETPTPTPTATTTETSTLTATATDTPTTAPSDTPPPSDTPVPTVGPTLSYPCTGTVVNPIDNTTLITEVYNEPRTSSVVGVPIRTGTVLSVQRQQVDADQAVWYLVYSIEGERHGWVRDTYISPSALCPR